ncbi:MAG: hypothetical protein K5654_05245, partial [Lachnospiraceae bacterium]|nr:hypothetical protein [Lachnospiraceae bacterium]
RYDENTLNALQATYSLKNKEFNLEDGITLEALEMLKERKANHKFEKAGQIAGRYHIGEGLQAVAFVSMLYQLPKRNNYSQPFNNISFRNNNVTSFADEMTSEEAEQYNQYWKRNAPHYNSPNSKMIFYKFHNGVVEESLAIYDEFGRLKYRIDFSNHGYYDHSVPHLHEYIYGHGYDPLYGKEIRYDIN